MTAIQGRILHIQRLSTEDGPGIRTTVFFKGCPLRCTWCHNPESLSSQPQTQWFAVRCIGCNTCLTACPNGCLSRGDVSMGDGTSPLRIDRARCEGCGTCAEACPSGALETLGRLVTADELLAELVKDRAYYEKSGGGVTLSGGEPAFQPDFAEALLRGLKAQGISTALDTCGVCSTHTLDRLLPAVDLVLYDLKLADPEQHRRATGQTNRQILDNLRHVRDWIRSQDRPVGLWIRTPLIPQATTSPENLSALGRFIAVELDGTIARWELCAFNNLCRDQYARLGLEWAYAQTPLMGAEELAQCGDAARRSGVSPELVFTSGATRATDTSTCC
jgi:pyruvate formate lyase activating enzyme